MPRKVYGDLGQNAVRANVAAFEELEAEMKKVNTGLFVGSKEFRNIIAAVKDVKVLQQAARPNMLKADVDRLRTAYENLQGLANAYLEKKEKESAELAKSGKTLSSRGKSRVAFAEKLKAFTAKRISGAKTELEVRGTSPQLAEVGKDFGLEVLLNAYAPKPEYREDLASVRAYYGFPKDKYDEATPKFSVDDFSINGQQLTDKDFSSLAIAATGLPSVGSKGRDATENEKRLNAEVDPKVVALGNATFWTADIALTAADGTSGCRAGCLQEGFVTNAINPARSQTYLALMQYKAGDPKYLAEIIATGVRDFEVWTSDDVAMNTSQMSAQTEVVNNLLELANKDPKLMEEVKTASDRMQAESAQKAAQYREEYMQAEQALRTKTDPWSGEALEPGSKAYLDMAKKFDIARSGYGCHARLADMSWDSAQKTAKAYAQADKIGKECNKALAELRTAALEGVALSEEKKGECIKAIFRESMLNAAMVQRRESKETRRETDAIRNDPALAEVLFASPDLTYFTNYTFAMVDYPNKKPLEILQGFGEGEVNQATGISKGTEDALRGPMQDCLTPAMFKALKGFSEGELLMTFNDSKDRVKLVSDCFKAAAAEKERARRPVQPVQQQPQAQRDQNQPQVQGNMIGG